MSNLQLIISEYNNLRTEIAQRVKLLHQFLLVADIFILTFLFMSFAMISSGVSQKNVILLLCFAPIVFSLLTFNYQANQMTLEGIAGYINHQLRKKLAFKDKKDLDEWDVFYGEYKRKFQLTSFLKTMPLVLPMTLPIWIYIYDPSLITYPLNLLIYFDLLLFVLVIFNFRYKIGR